MNAGKGANGEALQESEYIKAAINLALPEESLLGVRGRWDKWQGHELVKGLAELIIIKTNPARLKGENVACSRLDRSSSRGVEASSSSTMLNSST